MLLAVTLPIGVAIFGSLVCILIGYGLSHLSFSKSLLSVRAFSQKARGWIPKHNGNAVRQKLGKMVPFNGATAPSLILDALNEKRISCFDKKEIEDTVKGVKEKHKSLEKWQNCGVNPCENGFAVMGHTPERHPQVFKIEKEKKGKNETQEPPWIITKGPGSGKK